MRSTPYTRYLCMVKVSLKNYNTVFELYSENEVSAAADADADAAADAA